MSQNKTTFENKCNILADLWMSYRFDKKFSDFIEYNDIGLPLGFLLSEELVKPTPQAKAMVEETFDLLLNALDREDNGYESLDDVMVG
jgi:hypothetical protein